MGAAMDNTAEIPAAPPSPFNDKPDIKDKILYSGPDSGASVDEESLADADGYESTGNHIFSDPSVAKHWRGVYKKAAYENRHRFQSEFQWTAEEEKKVLKKIDVRIMILAWIMFCALEIHRRNIHRAISDDMLKDLGMTTNDFNYGQSVFLGSFLAAELPPRLISKRVGIDRWIPTITVGWSIVAGSQAFITNKAQFYIIKVLLIDRVSYPARLVLACTQHCSVNIFGSLLAAGLLEMRGINGWAGWQWLFLIEGILTIFVGLFSLGLMPPGPCETPGWFRGKDGWFNEREEVILVNRLLRDDPSKGDMNNRQGVGPSQLWKVLRDWEMLPLCMLGLTTYIPPSPIKNYLSLILRELGFSIFNANLLAIPAEVFFVINLIILTRVSKKLNERAIVASVSQLWMLRWFIALVVTLNEKTNLWVRYAVLTGIISYPYCHAILGG
ncbi:major facilitator superfamily domain-containing protein [Cladorrhinum sp. PSN332]|nr:major facilitator superfamily domain-containing protein [Cladorrhinum sp. PSN332]